MKKLIVIPALLLFLAASPNKMEPTKIKSTRIVTPYSEPISTKLDSINLKAAELDNLIKDL